MKISENLNFKIFSKKKKKTNHQNINRFFYTVFLDKFFILIFYTVFSPTDKHLCIAINATKITQIHYVVYYIHRIIDNPGPTEKCLL